MRVLVTGGAGYIGSHTAKALVGAGFEPVVLDDFSGGHRWAVKWGALVEGNLGDSAFVRRVITEYRAVAVIHFAASILVGESMTNPQKYFWNNVVNTLRLLDAMLEVGVQHIVFSSSAAVYGNPEKVPIPEDHPERPINATFMNRSLPCATLSPSFRRRNGSIRRRSFDETAMCADPGTGLRVNPNL